MDQAEALALVCERMSQTLADVAKEIRADNRVGADSAMGAAHMGLSWKERLLRQSLILDEIMAEGGSVSKDEWYGIAKKYGYSGRGLAGFFRSDGTGLLDMKGEKVTITRSGKARLKENRDRVDSWKAQNA